MRGSLAVVALASVLACRGAPTRAPVSPPPPEPALDSAAPSSEVTTPVESPNAQTKQLTRALERAARMHLHTIARCREIAEGGTEVFSPISIRAEIAPNGDVAKILSVDHAPDRKPVADCYAAELQRHHLERDDGGGAVTIEVVFPLGALDKDVIRRVVRAHLSEVRACYEAGLAKDPTIKGRVSIQFTIAPTGAVAGAVVHESEMGDAQVGRCIAGAVESWRFPEPEGGGNVTVTYPFALTPT